MLRSLFSGISGMRSHQTMLDVTGNNIANVNTNGFKSSSVQFQDTLSQLQQAAGGGNDTRGGTNPAQIGLGTQVAGISTNFAQGSAQATGKATDLMIAGDGFFVLNSGGQQVYSRAGSFDADFDARGRLVSPDGAFLQGWPAVNGVVQKGGAVSNIVLGQDTAPAVATRSATLDGNLPAEAAVGSSLVRDVKVYDASGNVRTLSLTFTRTAGGWGVNGSDGAGTGTSALTFTDGKLTGGGALTVGGINVDLTGVTGFAGLSTVKVSSQDGRAAGTLESFALGKDGSITGAFSNGSRIVIGQIALATFTNPGGLEKAGGSTFRATANSGDPALGTAGSPGFGTLSSGFLEMSNVDLSQEFTNLIVAQRGFQSNARVITTSDEVLQELTNLKR